MRRICLAAVFSVTTRLAELMMENFENVALPVGE
jgi:hypothetical protein